jgi:hypothetical protein
LGGHFFCVAGDGLSAVEVWLRISQDLLGRRSMDDFRPGGLLPAAELQMGYAWNRKQLLRSQA